MKFLKNLFGIKSEEVDTGQYLVATINDKVMPIDRGSVYEDPLDEFLKQESLGEITGGGTMQLESGELEYCDIEIYITSKKIDDSNISKIIHQLESFGAPKGSQLKLEKSNQTIDFGISEGLGIYLDGLNLDAEVYQNTDSNFVVSEVKRLINDQTETVRYWEGSEETGLYFYHNSFDEMESKIREFINTYPLCQNARVVKLT